MVEVFCFIFRNRNWQIEIDNNNKVMTVNDWINENDKKGWCIDVLIFFKATLDLGAISIK